MGGIVARAARNGAAAELHPQRMRLAGRDPGPEGSVGKLLWSRAAQYTMHVALDVLGADALTGKAPHWLAEYFTSRPVSVYGGSSQIQKNILARMLDMPR